MVSVPEPVEEVVQTLNQYKQTKKEGARLAVFVIAREMRADRDSKKSLLKLNPLLEVIPLQPLSIIHVNIDVMQDFWDTHTRCFPLKKKETMRFEVVSHHILRSVLGVGGIALSQPEISIFKKVG